MNLLELPDIVKLIFDHVEDVRSLRNVCKLWNEILFAMPDCAFWRKYPLTPQNVCSYGLPKMMKLVNRRDRDLMDACQWGNLDIIKYLHQNGIDFNEAEVNCAFACACEHGHLDVVKYLHKYYNIKAVNNSAIGDASAKGHLDVIKYLHEHSADITAEDNYAVKRASVNGHLDVVKYLHQHGANITAENNYAIEYASMCGHLKVVKYLHRHGANIADKNNFEDE